MKKYTRDLGLSSKRNVGNALRSYFRFKTPNGERTIALSAAILKVAQWRLARLPKGISADQITRLLKAFDQSSATGKRDYAITRCFVDLGLRTTEVSRPQLDDVDRREGVAARFSCDIILLRLPRCVWYVPLSVVRPSAAAWSAVFTDRGCWVTL